MENKPINACFRDWLIQFNAVHFPDAEVTVLFIIEHVMQIKYSQLLSTDGINAIQYQQIDALVKRCLRGEPLAYVLQSAAFNGRNYFVREGVLIPRPETEELVQLAIHRIDELMSTYPSLTVLECGFGSGVISIELALKYPQLSFFAWDISMHAHEVATKNKETYSVTNLQLRHGDFFENVIREDVIHSPCLIVSNPPYISDIEFVQLDDAVKREPKEALVAPNHGMAIILELLRISGQYSCDCICEMGFRQRPLLREYVGKNCTFHVDLSGHDRFLTLFNL